jgi:uroporphyrinogen decarboxylase
MEKKLEQLRRSILGWDFAAVAEHVQTALVSGLAADRVMSEGLIPGLIESGRIPRSQVDLGRNIEMASAVFRPVPTPQGVTSREIVRAATEFGNPLRIPYSFYYNPTATDVVELAMVASIFQDISRRVGDIYTDAWGIEQQVTGRRWDKPLEYPLEDLSRLDSYHFPTVASPGMFRLMEPFVRMGQAAGKYIVAPNPVMMYEMMRQLMGFQALMVAHYIQSDGLKALLEKMTEMTIDCIEGYASIGGVDAFMTWEDWGMQSSLQMKVEDFCLFYKPYYARIVEAAHKHGMHFIWHNCGYIVDMFPDIIELGVDVLQFDQPRLMGHQRLINELGGKVCMWNTVDIQWSPDSAVSDDAIRAEVAEMVRVYDIERFKGGFIARHYLQPWDINLIPERQIIIYDAFMMNIDKD